VASTEVPADEHDARMIDDAPGPRYPVDDVREMTTCELHQPMKNMTFKVAIGDALRCLPEALHHGNPIRAGYARVSMDDIVLGFEDLELDFPTPEGDVRLGDVKHHIVLWQKKYIMFPGSAPRPPTLRNPSPPSPGESRPPTPPPVHRLRVSRRRPRVHLRHRISRCRPQCTSQASAHAVLLCTSSASGGGALNTTHEGKKRSKAATVSTTDKVVHKTTKIPGPSLKPLPQRAYDWTDKEIKVISDVELKAHFAPKVPEPKPTYSDKDKKWAWICLLKRPNIS
jgi:hypothetical protein